MDLLADVRHLLVPFLESLLPVRQIEQRVVLLLLPGEERQLAPCRHELLHFLHIVLGLLDARLKVDHLVTGALDVLPDSCRELNVFLNKFMCLFYRRTQKYCQVKEIEIIMTQILLLPFGMLCFGLFYQKIFSLSNSISWTHTYWYTESYTLKA